jgi:hypothetical protein
VSNFIYEWIILIDERQPNSKISVADWLEEAKSSTTIVDLEKKDLSSQSQQQQVV